MAKKYTHNRGWTRVLRKGNECSTRGPRRVNLVTNLVINQEERIGKCWRRMEHIRGHLWHRYSIAVNQVMVETVQLSKWWPQL